MWEKEGDVIVAKPWLPQEKQMGAPPAFSVA